MELIKSGKYDEALSYSPYPPGHQRGMRPGIEFSSARARTQHGIHRHHPTRGVLSDDGTGGTTVTVSQKTGTRQACQAY